MGIHMAGVGTPIPFYVLFKAPNGLSMYLMAGGGGGGPHFHFILGV